MEVRTVADQIVAGGKAIFVRTDGKERGGDDARKGAPSSLLNLNRASGKPGSIHEHA